MELSSPTRLLMTVVTLLGPGWAVPISDGVEVISAIFTVRGL